MDPLEPMLNFALYVLLYTCNVICHRLLLTYWQYELPILHYFI